ncbi:MAG: hypothetical protein ACRD0F_07230, partial [Acidimicrobiales bacterium]
MRRVVALIVVGLAVSALAAPAAGDASIDTGQAGGSTGTSSITAAVTLPGGKARTVARGASRARTRCTYYYLRGDPENYVEWEGHPSTRPDRDANPEGWSVIEEGETTRLGRQPREGELVVVRRIPPEGGTFLRACRRDGVEVSRATVTIEPRPGAVSEAEWLARSVLDEQPLPYPEARNSVAFIHWPTWLAVADWGEVVAEAEVGGLTSTATAVPHATTWATGDGHVVRCEGEAPQRGLGARPTDTSPCRYRWPRTSYRRGPGDKYL